MTSRLKKFSLYFILDGFQKASALLLVPIYTAYIEPEQYGIMSICMSVSSIAPIIFFVNIYQAAYFAVLRKECGAREKILSVLCFELYISVAVVALAMLLDIIIPGNLRVFGVPWHPYMYYTVIMSAFSVFPMTVNQILLGSEQLHKYAVFTVSCFVASTALILLFLIKFDMKAMSFVMGNLIVYGIVAVGVAVVVVRSAAIRLDRRHLLPQLQFSAPFVPHNLAHWARGWVDRLLLAWFSSPASTGVFHIAVTCGNVMNLGVEAFRNSNNPRFFALINNPEDQPRLVAMLTFSLCCFAFAALGLGLFCREILTLLTSKSYHEAYRYVPLVLTANLFSLIYLNTVVSLFETGKTATVAGITMTSSTVSVALSAVLISRFSIDGAAVSMVCSNALMAFLVYRKCQQDRRLPWPIVRAVLLAMLPLAALAVQDWQIAAKIVLYCAIGAVLLVLFRKDARTVGVRL